MRSRILLHLIIAALAVLLAAGCKSKAGPLCLQLKECCSGVKASAEAYAATNAPGLCDAYLSSGHTDENLCVGTLADVRRAALPVSMQTKKPIPTSCQ